MLWLILLLCLGLAGVSGYYRGPIRGAFALLGLGMGVLLAKPLSPLFARLLPIFGFHHPLWQLFLPGVIAFCFVVLMFKIAGSVLHGKVEERYKIADNEFEYYRWARLSQRLGLCLGLFNGAVCFFVLLLPVYVGGYFATEAAGVAGADLPAPARILTRLRAELHEARLDRVLAAHDPVPATVYQAADIVDLVLRNPPLETRLAHYPPLLVLGEMKEIKDIGADAELQKLIQSHATLNDLLAQPKIQALVTNAAIGVQIRNLVGEDLPDLQTYLTTGKSPKYDSQAVLGIWTIDLPATLAEEWKHNPNLTARQFAALRASLVPVISGLSLTARLDNQFLLKKQRPDSPESTAFAEGTWKNSGESFEVTLPGNKPDAFLVAPSDGTLHFPRDGHVLVFNKDS